MIVPVLGSFECCVWWGDIRARPVDALTAPLSEPELRRAAGFRREEDRRRFVTASWLLRTVAAAQLAVSPDEVRIDRSCQTCGRPHGRPRIRTGPGRLFASISHAANRVAVALSTAGMVGVDVEELTAAPGGIAYCALSPGERQVLSGLPEHAREEGFVRMWVRKEAALKATGHGLRIPPEKVEVSGPDEAPALIGWPLGPDPGRVVMRELDPGAGFAGVVAVLRSERPVRFSESSAEELRNEPALQRLTAG